jgi:hypothetical protein
MARKLRRVDVEFTYYAWTETDREAEEFADEAFRDEDKMMIASSCEVTAGSRVDWPGDCYVYGDDEDITIDQALAKMGLPSASDMAAARIAALKSAMESIERRERDGK